MALSPKYVSEFTEILWNSAQDYALLCGYNKLTKKLPISEIAKLFNAITSVIPSAASSLNQLADKAYVDFGVEQMAAKYLAYDAQGNPFPSYETFIQGPYYYAGEQVLPTKNDYVLVNGDEQRNNAITRYWYTGSSWSFQYVVNNTPLNGQQLAALNSTITAAKVDSYDQHIANTNIHTTQQEKESWNAKYSKPNGGIPPTDLVIDNKPTQDSENPAKSGGIYKDLQVCVEAVNKLNDSISAVLKQMSNLGSITADSISLMSVPKIGGSGMIIWGTTAANSIESEFVGQIYVNTSTKVSYIATAAESTTSWKQITNS